MNSHKTTLKKHAAHLVISSDARPKPYNRMIFGGFLEHFDNQVYGGVFEPGSPLADKQGFRLDVIEALRELKVPVIRWPGGCFVDAYHWRKGVGPERESYGDPRWGVIEPNTFGTHEFVELCRRVGAEPYICHSSVADPGENIDWVNYCNTTEGAMSELRTAHGHPEPYNVRYWSVGNERYDKAYVDRVRDTAKAMKAFAPDVQITCSGSQGGAGKQMPGVQPYLMEQAGDYLDYVSVHNYWLDRGKILPRYDYLTAISRCEMPDAYMRVVIDSLKAAGRDDLKIAFDEWNLRAWQHPGFPRDKIDDHDAPDITALVAQRRRENDVAEQYTMADALFAASFLNACLRNCGHVAMANIAPLVNTRGPLFVHAEGILKRPHFYALSMYANLLQPCVAAATVESDAITHRDTSVAVVDAIATANTEGTAYAFALMNRHPSQPTACAITLADRTLEGQFEATLLSSDSPDAFNDIECPERVVPETIQVAVSGSVALPPHSLMILHVPGKKR